MPETSKIETRCGFIAIVGRPNVGKSTLLNTILGKKVSITTSRPQTTRHRILGIKTIGQSQCVFVDTPGLHQHYHTALNRVMNKAVLKVIPEADRVLFLVEAEKFTPEDEWVAEHLLASQKDFIIGVNKIDQLSDKSQLLPFIHQLSQRFPNIPIVPFSAKQGDNVTYLLEFLAEALPIDHFYFGSDQLTDRSERFLAAELIREKLMRFSGQEIPYSIAVMIDQFTRNGGLLRISATIFVERDSQKAIVIGRNGERLKQVGSTARQNMERLFNSKVYLDLWVKVKTGWSDDTRALKSLGYDEQD